MDSRYIFHVPMCHVTHLHYYYYAEKNLFDLLLHYPIMGYFDQLINIILCHTNDK